MVNLNNCQMCKNADKNVFLISNVCVYIKCICFYIKFAWNDLNNMVCLVPENTYVKS